jgi:hypothetical protein
MSRIGREFFRHVVPQIIKPVRTLWNEMIGFVFLCLAAVPVPRTFRQWRQFDETGDGLFQLALSVAFIVLMASFGIHSFWRARKIARS